MRKNKKLLVLEGHHLYFYIAQKNLFFSKMLEKEEKSLLKNIHTSLKDQSE